MNYNEALDKLKAYKQEHILKYYDDLSQEEKSSLLKQIEETDFSVLKQINANTNIHENAEITPIKAMTLEESFQGKDSFEKIGLNAIKAGKVAAVLLAGGMGTRLGFDAPKGMYDIGETKSVYIFERIICNLMDVTKKAACPIPLFIMTSDKNHQATTSFFEEHNYFSYDKDYIYFFKQEMAPASDYQGKIYMESKYHIASSPNGNGGWFASMLKAGYADVFKEKGIEWLNVFAVDNVLQRIADPLFIGATISKGMDCGAKVVAKANPDEKVGVMCKKDGKPSIVEYYEMTDKLRNTTDDSGKPAYNYGVILNYLFKVSALNKITSPSSTDKDKTLPLHIVEKKIPHIDSEGQLIKPDKPNGYKFETLILDMIELMSSCLPFEVVRNKEFAPIKNKSGIDSVESAKELLKENGIDL